MSGRESIIGALRGGLGRGELGASQQAALEKRIDDRQRGPRPSRIELDSEALADLFVQYAEGVDISVDRVASMETLEDELSRRAAARRCHDARGRPQEAERSRTRCECLSLGIVVAGHPVVQKDERCLTSCFFPRKRKQYEGVIE